ncbi:MAG TPA: hypothetical protein DEP72_08370 [Clostridiales bacterium]|nr:hypothetical protein [Clostridiales bacterium]
MNVFKFRMVFIVLITMILMGCSKLEKGKDITVSIENVNNQKVHKEKTEIKDEKYFFNKPEATLKDASIEIYKSDRLLKFYEGDKVLGVFKIALGTHPLGHKKKEGDKKTPQGEYYICTRNDKSKYTLFLGLSYPNKVDAENGYDANMITKSEYEEIGKSIDDKKAPSWNTKLGGAIGIHGGGADTDWTWGCIALSDDDIKILWDYTNMGTRVLIYE